MPERSVADSLASVRAALGQARAGFVDGRPAAIEALSERLDAAANQLGECVASLRRSDTCPCPVVSETIRQIRAETHVLVALFDSWAEFHQRWTNLARTMTLGYAPDGSPAEPFPEARLTAEG